MDIERWIVGHLHHEEVKGMKTGSSKSLVTIKGTKDGLTILLDDQCSFDDLKSELKEKMTRDQHLFGNGPEVVVNVDGGYRYFKKDQEEDIRMIIEDTKTIRVGSFHSEVMSREDVKKELEESSLTTMKQIIRSGQVISVKGDVLLLGDVNPGGVIEATGNIYVLGTLKGIARAGIDGYQKAVVSASVMTPKQISIADVYFYAPERHEREENADEPLFDEPVYAYIHEEQQEVAFEKARYFHRYPSIRRTS